MGEISDGRKIACQPTRHFTGTADGYAKGAGMGVYAFSDKDGTYVITALYSDANTLEPLFRGSQLAATLESINVGK